MTAYNKEDLVDHHGITAIIYDERGNILMQDHIKLGFWTMPVGKVKEGQEIIDALKEEISEECGIVILKCKEVGSFTKIYNRSGTNVKVTQHIFEVEDYSGTPKNLEPHKHRNQIFINLNDIKNISNLSDASRYVIEYLTSKTIFLAREAGNL